MQKKYGRDGMIKHIDDLIILREAEKAAQDKESKKKTVQKKIDTLKAKKNIVEDLVNAIGEPIDEDGSKMLILRKHHNVIQEQLEHYLNREKRELVSLVEKLWDKYAVSRNALEGNREDTLVQLNQFLSALKYQ